MELIVILIGLAALGWILVGPILFFSQSSQISHLRMEIERLSRELGLLKKKQSSIPVEAVTLEPAPPHLQKPPTKPPAPHPVATPLVASSDTVQPPITINEPSTPSPIGRPVNVTSRLLERQAQHISEQPLDDASAWVSETPAPQVEASHKPPRIEKPPRQFDELVASQWLSWVGAVAVMLGVGFGLKYIIDEQLLGPLGRVTLGILSGIAMFATAVFAMRKDYRILAEALAGAALGTLYFSLFAAYQWYDLMPQPIAFIGMIFVTAAGLSFAGIFHSLPSAILAMIGGFLTPYLLSKGGGNVTTLFSYILILDLGVLALATFRRWGALHLVNFGGTLLIWCGWLSNGYVPEELWLTVAWITLFGVVFSLMSLWRHVIRKEESSPPDVALMLLTPISYFGALYGLTKVRYSDFHGMMAMLVALYYLGLGAFAYLRNRGNTQVVATLVGIGLSFVTLAVPLQLTGHWISIMWALEGLLLIELGLRYEKPGFRLTGFALLATVQLHMVMYTIGTLARPHDFTTRFVRQLWESPNFVESGKSAMQGLINGRSMSFLANAVVLAILGWEYRRREKTLSKVQTSPTLQALGIVGGLPDAHRVAAILIPAVPIVVLVMGLLETFVHGVAAHWLVATHLSVLPIWLSIFAVGVLLAFRQMSDVGTLRSLAKFLYGITGCLLLACVVTRFPDWDLATHGMWGWTVFNPRGVGFLSALSAALFGAVLLSERGADDTQGRLFGNALTVAVPLVLLGMCLTESFAYGQRYNWIWATHASVAGIVLALITVPVRLVGHQYDTQPSPLTPLSQIFYIGLSGVIAILYFGTMLDWGFRVRNTLDASWDWPFLNPRGICFLLVAMAGAIGSRLTPKVENDRLFLPAQGGVTLGLFTYVIVFLMFTIEVFAQGKQHHWETHTSLAITGTWTFMAILTIGAGLVWRSAPVRIVALSVFALTTTKVFLYDVWYLEKPIRAAAFLVLGLALFATTFLYRRFSGQLKEWIKPTN